MAPKSYGDLTRNPDSGLPVRILLYHAVIPSPLEIGDWCFLDAGFFREQMVYIKKNFEVLALTEAVARMRENKIRHPTIVITFDDGFQNNYEFAFPILREIGIPATLFLVTGLIDTDDTLWFCRLNRALEKCTGSTLRWRSKEYKIVSTLDKRMTARMIQAELKSLPHPELLMELRTIRRNLGDNLDSRVEDDSPYRMLKREQIMEMTKTGLIELGSHTKSHAILSLLSPQKRLEEITHSLESVQELTGETCRLFAYPNGRLQDYDQDCIQVLKKFGVDTAVTFIEGLNDCHTSTMELKRCGIGPHLDMQEFEELLNPQ